MPVDTAESPERGEWRENSCGWKHKSAVAARRAAVCERVGVWGARTQPRVVSCSPFSSRLFSAATWRVSTSCLELGTLYFSRRSNRAFFPPPARSPGFAVSYLPSREKY